MCNATDITDFACHLDAIKNKFTPENKILATALVNLLHGLAYDLMPSQVDDVANAARMCGADIAIAAERGLE